MQTQGGQAERADPLFLFMKPQQQPCNFQLSQQRLPTTVPALIPCHYHKAKQGLSRKKHQSGITKPVEQNREETIPEYKGVFLQNPILEKPSTSSGTLRPV